MDVFAQPYIQSGTPIPQMAAFNKLNEIIGSGLIGLNVVYLRLFKHA